MTLRHISWVRILLLLFSLVPTFSIVQNNLSSVTLTSQTCNKFPIFLLSFCCGGGGNEQSKKEESSDHGGRKGGMLNAFFWDDGVSIDTNRMTFNMTYQFGKNINVAFYSHYQHCTK